MSYRNSERLERKRAYKNLWLSFVSIVAILAIGLCVFYAIKIDKSKNITAHSAGYYQQQLTNVYRQSLYRLSDGLQNTEVNLGKMLVSEDTAMLNKLLVTTSGLAEGSVGDISALPLKAEVTESATKYFNQLSDYCKSIADDLPEQKTLTEEQKQSISELKSVAEKLKVSINAATFNDNGFKWETAEDGTNTQTLTLQMDDIDENTFDYPQLVYDGPFSDSVSKKTFDVEKISHEEAEQKLYGFFADYNPSNIEFKEEISANATVYVFDVTLNGRPFVVQTAQNGVVAQLNAVGESNFLTLENPNSGQDNTNDNQDMQSGNDQQKPQEADNDSNEGQNEQKNTDLNQKQSVRQNIQYGLSGIHGFDEIKTMMSQNDSKIFESRDNADYAKGQDSINGQEGTISSPTFANSSNMDENTCCETAQKMADALGYEVKPMWVSQTIDGRVYVNMIARQNDIVLYPDMVKMAIDTSSGNVVGIDAFGYIANHKMRKTPQNQLSAKEAQKSLNDSLEVNGYTLCVVPDGNNERFCYEFKCMFDGDSYLIYIDATNGQEVEILKIIEEKMGYTVM